MVVIGTRPEAIKLAPLIKKMMSHTQLCVKVCITGQHGEMLNQVLKIFEIAPDFKISTMRPGQPLEILSAALLTEVAALCRSQQPDIVLVHGDTLTAMMATLAAYVAKIRVVHIEAGLRTGDVYAPWPEEGFRCAIAQFANLHFAPTDQAVQNLRKENIAAEKIFMSGNLIVDALKCVIATRDVNSTTSHEMDELLKNASHRRLILVTTHRRENHGGGLKRIVAAIRLISELPDVHIIVQVHPNPIVTLALSVLEDTPNVRLVAPLDYLRFVYLMSKSYIILTDSGGIQEEAASIGKPLLVLREKTERPEGITAGVARLVGTDVDAIFQQTKMLLDDIGHYKSMARSIPDYGDGHAADRIVEEIVRQLRAYPEPHLRLR